MTNQAESLLSLGFIASIRLKLFIIGGIGAGAVRVQGQAACQRQAVQALVGAAASSHAAVRQAAAAAAGPCLTGELLGGLFLPQLVHFASTGGVIIILDLPMATALYTSCASFLKALMCMVCLCNTTSRVLLLGKRQTPDETWPHVRIVRASSLQLFARALCTAHAVSRNFWLAIGLRRCVASVTPATR